MFGLLARLGTVPVAVMVAFALGGLSSAWMTHRMDAAALEKIRSNYVEAQARALQGALDENKRLAEIAQAAAVSAASAQEKIQTRTVTLTREIPRYVTDTSSCITYGLIRVLDATVL